MIKRIQELSLEFPKGHIELQLVGGYSDEKGISDLIFYETMYVFQSISSEIHVTLMCLGNLNTEMHNGVPWPIAYGVGVNLKTGE